MRKSLILRTGLKVILPLMLVGSAVVFWRGHQMPGGGFIGGLLAGAGLAVHTFAFGRSSTLQMIRIQPLSFVVVGLSFSLLSGVLALFVVRQPLTSLWLTIPFLEKVGTPILFDLGVYFVVFGFVMVFITETVREES